LSTADWRPRDTPTTLQLCDIDPERGGRALPAIFEELNETPLIRSPIVAVVWQLRFEDHPVLVAPQTALKLQELLGGETAFSITNLPQIKLSVQPIGSATVQGASAPASGSAGGGWRLSAADGSWHLNIEPSSLSIESSSYGSWSSDFLPRLQQVLDALEKVGPPVIESRLGLRFINIVVGSAVGHAPFEGPSELNGLISPWLLGPLGESKLRDFVQMNQGRAVLRFDRSNAILNHGVVSTENGELGYLVDVDAFREGGRAFRKSDVLADSETLHKIALGVFQASLTDEILNSMRASQSEDSS
jgi:uncharacterized protein (TIGR04255 family)